MHARDDAVPVHMQSASCHLDFSDVPEPEPAAAARFAFRAPDLQRVVAAVARAAQAHSRRACWQENTSEEKVATHKQSRGPQICRQKGFHSPITSIGVSTGQGYQQTDRIIAHVLSSFPLWMSFEQDRTGYLM